MGHPWKGTRYAIQDGKRILFTRTREHLAEIARKRHRIRYHSDPVYRAHRIALAKAAAVKYRVRLLKWRKEFYSREDVKEAERRRSKAWHLKKKLNCMDEVEIAKQAELDKHRARVASDEKAEAARRTEGLEDITYYREKAEIISHATLMEMVSVL